MGYSTGLQGAGGGGGSIVPSPDLRTLVHQNNLSTRCDALVDSIIFNERHVGNSLSQGFNANAGWRPDGSGRPSAK